MFAHHPFVPAICALLLASASLAQTPVTFVQPTSIGVCQTLATADFNGDGNLDVACGGETLTIWLGDGHGHFRQTAQQLPYADALVVTGDFNGDGRIDLIVATYNYYLPSYGQVAFLPGKGNGTFGAQVAISSMAVTALATVRPNPNGPLDLVANVLEDGLSPGLVQVFPGNGDGTFQNPITTGINSTTNIAVADFNGDGIPDLASIGELEFGQALLQVVLGNADGSFGSLITTTIATVEPFEVGDFNGDGIPDVAWSDSSDIYVYQGNGDGTFSAGPVTSTETGQVLLATDLNGDGLPDLVMAGMAVAMNLGGGKFGPSQWYQNPSGNGGVAGDFRNQNVQDLMVAGDYYENTGSGRFREPRSYPAGCTQCSYLATGDFNNDGNLDAAVAGNHGVQIFAGNGGGNFTGVHKMSLTLPAQEKVTAAAAADFNGDGNLDLAVGTDGIPGTGEVLILPGNGDDTFGSPTVAYSGHPVFGIATADFNRSGHMGLALATNESVVVLCGNGAGGFTATAVIQGLANSSSLVVTDFNRDGIPDLATASDVYLGNGNGTFRHAYTLPQSWTAVQTGDFNGDGIPDLLTYNNIENEIIYWPGIGDGTFGLPAVVSTMANAVITAVADLNGDGISDIVTADFASSTITLYLGNANGLFTTEAINNLPETSNFPMAAGTFNNGSPPDLLFVSLAGQLVDLINSTR